VCPFLTPCVPLPGSQEYPRKFWLRHPSIKYVQDTDIYMYMNDSINLPLLASFLLASFLLSITINIRNLTINRFKN
jgi:hypothetical protein